ncbi:hypothetical protein [Thaumasiovibrio sp. DFM-14]|uniref:hypothetical protein n=1 Tax=Thaumasiovibrio sp. DFM-14 TaxID=3384792 RepID=UPI00399FBC8A
MTIHSSLKPNTGTHPRELLEQISLERDILEHAIKQVHETNTLLYDYYHEKSIEAAESARYYLRQRQQLLGAGLPSSSSSYWQLVDAKLATLLAVFKQLNTISPAYLGELEESYPQVLLWLCLNLHEFAITPLYCLVLQPQVVPDNWCHEVGFGVRSDIDSMLVAGLFHEHQTLRQSSLAALIRRRSCDSSQLRQYCQDRLLPSDVRVNIHQYYALQGDYSLRDKLQEDGLELQCYPAFLYTYPHVRRWWLDNSDGLKAVMTEVEHRCYRYLVVGDEETTAICYAQQGRDIDVVLSGEKQHIPRIIEYLCDDVGDDEFSRWFDCLVAICGERLPIDRTQAEHSAYREQIPRLIEAWWEKENAHLPCRLRMGQHLSFSSSLMLLGGEHIPARYREWVWRQIGIGGRSYAHFSCFEAPAIQRTVIQRLSASAVLQERFDLRIRDAAVGY